MRHFFSGANLVALAILFLFSASSAPQLFLQAGETRSRQDAEKGEGLSDRQIAALESVMKRTLERVERDLPRPGQMFYEVHPTAARLGLDPEKIFPYVRDRIRNEPYRGLLRGPRGTIMSRGGNALDKSFLLRQLLRTSGYEAVLVRGTLAAQEVTGLIDRSLVSPPSLLSEIDFDKIDRKAIAAFSRDVGTPAEETNAALAEIPRGRRELLNRAWALGRHQEEDLGRAFSAAGIRGAMDPATLRKRWERDVSDHYWVRYKDPARGKWIALDPSFSDAIPGTEKGRSGKIVRRLPDDSVGRFRISLELDRIVKKKREVKELVSISLPICLALWEPISIEVVPAETPPAQKSIPGLDAASRYKLFAGIRKYQALLRVGLTTHGSFVFDLDGAIYNVTGAGKLGKQMGEIFGGIFDRLSPGEKKKKSTRLVALNARFKMRLPGRRVKEQTRKLYDGNQPEERDRIIPIVSADVFVQSHWIHPAFSLYQGLLARKSMLKAHLGIKGCGACVPYPVFLLDFAMMRQSAVERINGDSGKDTTVFFDSPKIVLLWRGMKLQPATRSVKHLTRLDILEGPPSFVPVSKKGEEEAWRRNLRLGIFGSSLEGILFDDPALFPKVEFAVGQFERSRLAGKSLRVIPPEKRTEMVPGLFSREDAEWIRKNTPGDHALAYFGSGRVAHWWSVDIRNGACVARVSGGAGGAEAETLLWQGGTEAATLNAQAVDKATDAIGWSLIIGLFMCFAYAALSIVLWAYSLMPGWGVAKDFALCLARFATMRIALARAGPRGWLYLSTFWKVAAFLNAALNAMLMIQERGRWRGGR